MLKTNNNLILEEYNSLVFELSLLNPKRENDKKRKKWIESRIKELEAIFNY